MIVDRYYYGKLPDKEKAVYKEIYQGCMEHKDIIPISSSIDIDKSYERIVSSLMNDNPLMYFVNQSRLDFAKDINGNVAAIPQYYFNEANVKKYNQKIQDSVNELIAEIKLNEGSELDKVRKVHDYMCSNVQYDFDGGNINDVKSFIASHNIIGVLAHKKAQCEGIAKTAKVLLNAVGVKCIFVTGKVEDKTGKAVNHGWNIVSIDGAPYHMDITSDIGAMSDGFIAYDYYNVNDAQIRKDHVFSTGLPRCVSHDAGYFETSNSIFSSKKKLFEYVSQRINDGD